MKTKKLYFYALMALSLLPSYKAMAREPELDELIKATNEKSLANKASAESVSAAKIEKDRSDRHWLPQVYLTGQSYLSNDPGAALFGKLSQREVKNTDFMPDALNHPETSVYHKAALGLNFPLYEGGQKSAVSKAMGFMSEAKVMEAKAVSIEFGTEVKKHYFQGKNLSLEKSELIKISDVIESIISRYQIGSRSNPLGHSGLLGLKSVKNKIAALLEENNAKSEATKKALAELSGSEKVPTFKNESTLKSLLKEYMTYSENTYVPSSKVQSYFENAKSAKELISAEKSRNLPRLGLFGEGYLFNGERATDKGYTTGLYLNWNLFSGSDQGAAQEAIHKSKAAEYFAEASLQKETIEYNALKDALVAIDKSLLLLDESENFLEEQTRISHSLFKNGLINALQYVEVLSRRVDLIKSKSEAENQLIQTYAQLAKHTNAGGSL